MTTAVTKSRVLGEIVDPAIESALSVQGMARVLGPLLARYGLASPSVRVQIARDVRRLARQSPDAIAAPSLSHELGDGPFALLREMLGEAVRR